jgi:hypothetical protein
MKLFPLIQSAVTKFMNWLPGAGYWFKQAGLFVAANAGQYISRIFLPQIIV